MTTLLEDFLGRAEDIWTRNSINQRRTVLVGNGVALNIRLRCTSLVQAAAAVGQLGLAAVLPSWAATAFAPGQMTRLHLPLFRSLQTPLRLAWNKRQVEMRPFLGGIAEELGQILAKPHCVAERGWARGRVLCGDWRAAGS